LGDLFQTLITAVSVGSLYALIALGYTMVYGILKFINFAHSDVVVLGAWVSYTLSTWLLPKLGYVSGQPALWYGGLVLLLAMIVCGAVGFCIERFAYRPLRGAPRLNVLITAIGVSLLLQNTGQLQFDLGDGLRLPFGTQPQGMPQLLENKAVFDVVVGTRTERLPDGTTRAIEQRVVLGRVDLMIILTAATLMVLLQLLVYRTKLGAAMRAVSYSTTNAALMGVPVDRVISFTFVLGSALAAAAGFLYGMKYTTLQQTAHTAWVLLGLKAFISAVVGGIGNIQGAVVGAFLIAFIEQFGARYISSDMKDVYVFAVLIVVLLVKPTGVLGSTVREKV
jgi:branched-chain amino acid transport system permease protein